MTYDIDQNVQLVCVDMEVQFLKFIFGDLILDTFILVYKVLELAQYKYIAIG